MSSFPLRDTLLPAVLVSSSVFSLMTLPLVLIKPEPIVINLPPIFEGEIQPLFEGSDRSLAIPYIGCAIVASVGAGVATVELTRRRQSTRSLVQFEEFLAYSQPQPQDLPVEADQVDPVALSQSEFDDSERLAGDYFDEQFLRSNGAAASRPLPLEGSIDAFEPNELADQEDTPFTSTAVLLSPHHYQTCRISVPRVEQRLFAVFYEDEYYSLFRARKTREKALEIAEKLTARGDRAVVTPTEQGYAVWMWEPEAHPCRA